MTRNRLVTSLFLAGALLTQVVMSGCVARVGVGYNARDRYHNDYHRWDDNEIRFYSQWNVETHRPSGREYRRLKRDEQREYWNWRHDRH